MPECEAPDGHPTSSWRPWRPSTPEHLAQLLFEQIRPAHCAPPQPTWMSSVARAAPGRPHRTCATTTPCSPRCTRGPAACR
jgi:hypothetical protein